MKLRETLATNLKNIREKRNFSQRGMAEKIEMLFLPENAKFVYINSQNNTNNQEVKSGYFNDDSLMKVIDKLLKHNEKLFSEHRTQQ